MDHLLEIEINAESNKIAYLSPMNNDGSTD